MFQNIFEQIEQEDRESSLNGDGEDIDSVASSTST